MNILQYAAISERNAEIRWAENGYERKTTFWSDFTIADVYGKKAVKDTFKGAKIWIDNLEYWVELILVLNHKIWEHYEKNEELAKVYDELWRKADAMFWKKYEKNEEAVRYHFKVLD